MNRRIEKINKPASDSVLLLCSDISDRLGSRGSFDVSVIPGDLLLSDHGNRLAKRNTIADLSSGPRVNLEGRKQQKIVTIIKLKRAEALSFSIFLYILDHRRGKSSFSLIKKVGQSVLKQ